MSGDFRLRTSLWGFFEWRVVFNQRCCVFIQCNLLKGSYECILKQTLSQAVDYSLPGLTWNIRLRIYISHLSISGIVVHGRCYVSHCFYFPIIILWFLWLFTFAFAFMPLDSRLNNQESSLTCLLSFWLIIRLYHYCHGSIALYNNILYY